MKKCLVVAAVALAIGAAPVSANNNGNGGGGGGSVSACSLSNLSPAAVACSGFFAGNLLSGNAGDIAAQQAGLSAIGLVWNGVFANVTKIDSLNGATTVDFSTANQNPVTSIFGETWIGLHFGGGAGLGANATAFYRLDAGVTGLRSLLLNIGQGSSGAVLYQTGDNSVVPEPASWAMMIAGFGMIGALARRRKSALVVSA